MSRLSEQIGIFLHNPFQLVLQPDHLVAVQRDRIHLEQRLGGGQVFCFGSHQRQLHPAVDCLRAQLFGQSPGVVGILAFERIKLRLNPGRVELLQLGQILVALRELRLKVIGLRLRLLEFSDVDILAGSQICQLDFLAVLERGLQLRVSQGLISEQRFQFVYAFPFPPSICFINALPLSTAASMQLNARMVGVLV